MGQSPDEDAFYVTIGDNQQQRMWPEEPGEILPTGQLVYFTQKADGPCDILLSFAESNVKLDCVEFKEVP